MDGIGRRGFLGLGTGAAFAAALPAVADTVDAAAYLKPRRISVACGLSRPFSVLHVSDTHLTLMSAKELENADRARLHRDRNGPAFPHGRGAKGLAAAVAYAAAREGVDIFSSLETAVFPLEFHNPYDIVAGTKGHLVAYEANTAAMKAFLDAEEEPMP